MTQPHRSRKGACTRSDRAMQGVPAYAFFEVTVMDDAARMNRAYSEMLSEPYPARTTVYVRLRKHMLVEIDGVCPSFG